MTLYTRLFLVVALFFSVSLTYAGQKIAYVNQAKVLQKAPQAESARGKLQKEFSQRDKSLLSLQNRIKAKEKKLNNDAASLSTKNLQKLKRELTSLRRDLERDKQAFKEDVSMRQNEELVKLQKSVLNSIKNIAQQERYDLVLSDGVLYASDSIDITDKVLLQLKKQYSSK